MQELEEYSDNTNYENYNLPQKVVDCPSLEETH